MFKFKKQSLIFLMIMIVFMLMPLSFAADIDDNNATDVIGISYSTDNLESTNSVNELSVDESNIENVEGSSDEDVLSVNYDYETTITNPSSASVDYELGDTSVEISVKVTTTSSLEYISNSKMYAFINGASNGIVVKDTYNQDISGTVKNANFIFRLSQFDDYLVNPTNTIIFHPPEDYYDWDGIDNYNYQKLIVNIKSGSGEPYTGIIYVNESGSDDNEGSEELPVATIAKAIELATSDSNTEHKIIVNEGTYTLSNAQLNSNLTISGEGRVIVAPESGKYHVFLGGNNNYEFNNIIFVNGTQTTSAISMSTSANKKVKINNCSFINNTGYNYIIYSYGEVTISNCNFINNTVKAGSSAGVIYAYSGSLNVSYSNFINNKNTGSSGYSDVSGQTTGDGWDISYQANILVENNYWGSNNGPSTSQFDKNTLSVTKYVKLTATINAEKVLTGSTYDITLKFTDKNGNDLTENMPELNVDVGALGTLDKNTVTISKNTATISYTAGEVGEDTFTVKINDANVATLPITVESDKYTGTIYVGGEGSSDENMGSQTAPVATIAKAIELATSEDNDDHAIIINAGNYTEYNLNIASNLTITGNGNVVVNADKKGRIFKITNGDVKLNGLTLTNGVAPADFEIETNYWSYSENYSVGGAILIGDAEVTIDNLKIINSTATNYGGAIYLSQKTKISNSTFENNTAEYGGAIYIAVTDDYDYVGNTIQENTFITNNATSQGGAISIVFKGNSNYVAFMEFNTIDNNIFIKNNAVTGGAIANDGYKIIVSDNTFDANTANRGASITNGKYVRLINNTMTNGVATEKGNDVYNVGEILSYTNLVFIDGETITIDGSKSVELTVKVTDDNGNTISGGEITFTVDGNEIDVVNLTNGVATTKFTPHENGTLTVSGIYNGAYYDEYDEIYRVNLTNGTLEVSNAVPEYFGIIYVATNGDDENDGSSDSPVNSINKAINLATREGGSNSIVIREGTYNVTGYSFTTSINITGEGNPILDAQNNGAIFTLTGKDDTNFVFVGLTFANGEKQDYSNGGGAVSIKGGNLYLENDTFVNCTSIYNGGALYISQGAMDYSSYPYVASYGNATIVNCTFENNGNGKNYAGAVYVYGSRANVEIIGSTFKNNTAGSGGAIYVSSSSVNITDSKFIDNGATSDGSAIYLSGNAIIKNNEFAGNNVSSIYIYNSNNEITLESNTIESESTEILTNSLNINGITVTILDNGTKSFFEGDITLNATVTDDNGNKISANNFYFIVNGTELGSVKLENGIAEVTYNATLNDNNVLVTAYGAKDIKTAILNIVKYGVTITFEDASGNVGENINISFTAVDSLNNPITDNVSVKFNDETFSVNASEGIVSITLPETANTYDLTISYGNESVTKTITVEAPKIKYVSTPEVESIEYLIGEHKNITININCEDLEKFESYDKLLAYIEGYSEAIEINTMANENPAIVDLKLISDKYSFTAGQEYIIYFHPDVDDLSFIGIKSGEYEFKPLKVSVTGEYVPEPSVVYNSTPAVNGESSIEYTKGDSKIINVTVSYDESSLSSSYFEYLKSANMLIFINDAEGVAISSVNSGSKSFTIDLADYSNSLIVGVNNISFHPRNSLLETVFGNENIFIFNNLTVNASEPIIPDYTGIIYVASSESSDDNNGSSDNPVASIKKAIELASNKYNTEHKIIIREGTYEEFDLNITSDLDISAEGDVIIDARELGRILNITADTNITGITFKNGKANDGGAIYIKNAKVSIDNSKFYNNNGSTWGGAIYWDADNGKLTNSIFEENSARNGAAIQLGVYDVATLKTSGKNGEIINCTFNNNDNLYNAAGSIGVSVFGSGVNIKDSNFTNNHGRENSNHGALYIYGSDATVDNCLFENNTMDEGAGLHLDGDNVVVKNCKFINNTNYANVASRSGAIHIGDSANAKITGNVFIANGGSNCSSGGAINIVYNDYGGEIVISNNKFINNSAAYGGAICVDGGQNSFDLTIDNNTFDGNKASNGAGIYLDFIDSSSAPTISNNEFKNNEATYGTGIYVSSYITVKLSKNTMNSNDIYIDEDADIDGELILTFNDGVAVVGEVMNLTATLVDDNGNLVSGVTITFKSGNNTIGENTTVGGIATIEFTPSVIENYTITGSTSLYGDVTVNNGIIIVSNQSTTNGTSGNNTGNVTNGTSGNGNSSVVTKIGTKITATSITTIYNVAKNIVITLKDANGKALSSKKITIKINGKTEIKSTNKNGQVSISVNLPPKSYTASITFAGDSSYIKSSGSAKIVVNKATPVLTASKKSYKVKATKKYSATLKDNKGKVIKNAKVTIKVNGKTYSAKTNSKGIVTFKLTKLTKKGSFNAVVKFAGSKYYNAVSKTVKITVKK